MPSRDVHRLRNGLIWTAGLLLVLGGVTLAVPDLSEVVRTATEAAPGWLVAGTALEIASCLGYVATVRLVLRRSPAREVRRLAWAELAFGAVVPAGGAGGLAVGAWAMRAWGISWARIANRSAVIFLLTTVVNLAVLPLAGAGLLLGVGGTRTALALGLVPATIGAAALASLFLLPRLCGPDTPNVAQSRVRRTLHQAAGWVRDTERLARRADWRLLGAVGYLVFDMATLWLCLRAVGVAAPVLALVLGYQIGNLATLVPVPGSIGVLEAGLVGGLVLYGLPPVPTAAAVVLYHAIALWTPTLGGAIGFARLRTTVTTRAPGAKRPVDHAVAGISA